MGRNGKAKESSRGRNHWHDVQHLLKSDIYESREVTYGAQQRTFGDFGVPQM